MAQDNSGSLTKFFLGVGVGVTMSFVYVRFGISGLPGILGLGQKLTENAVVSTAEFDLYAAETDPAVRYRALAVVVANKPELFIHFDQATGGQIMEEALRQKAIRTAQLLKAKFDSYDKALALPELRKAQVRSLGGLSDQIDDHALKRRMLWRDIQEEEFLQYFLAKTYGERTSDEVCDLILNVYRNQLRPIGIAGRNPTALP